MLCREQGDKPNRSRDDQRGRHGGADAGVADDFIPAGCRTPKDGITDAAMMAYLLTKPELRLKLIHDLAKSREDKIKRQKKTKAPKTEL